MTHLILSLWKLCL